jgi:hypothetical protein
MDVVHGEFRYWPKCVYPGFDQAGNCLTNTGFTSLFNRFTSQCLVFELSPDGLVERRYKKVVQDNFSGRNIRVEAKISDDKHNQILVSQTIPVDELVEKNRNLELLHTTESYLPEILFINITNHKNPNKKI